MRLGMYMLPWREPSILASMEDIPGVLEREGLQRPLVITDAGLARAGLLDRLNAALIDWPHAIYDGVVPNPTTDNIEAARALYLDKGCDCLIALGGGSPMDCAKAVGARIARPKKPVSRMRGQLKVLRRVPTLIAIPTTSGTGSEATLAAVVADPAAREKYAINDPALIPSYAVLDPNLTLGLPPDVTAQTGMDALTHAIEAYIGRSNTRKTRDSALLAIRLIDEHLVTAFSQGTNLDARLGMQRASYLAGTAFTRAYVGYVHAIAHQLGALYGTPHGLANAILLPHVLSFYGEAVYAPMSDIYEAYGGPDPEAPPDERARYVIGKIHAVNRLMGIPARAADIRERDIARIVEGAYREAVPLYPAPRMLDRRELTALVRSVMAEEPKKQ
ncbi:iron-containing alcohol dehydrogenase [Eubacteriales bacterium OttesenSCG-928-A19]|nr:iron-containing alcohol dehydrogenase [Eubacteriales bacterium OttesenSCG-928-A19]